MNALEALSRCQRAWEATQPQLFFELYPDGLDEPQPSALRFVEPAVSPCSLPNSGLAPGAEPCRDTPRGLTANPPVTAAPAPSSASAPFSNEPPPVADPWTEQRGRGQEVTL